MNNYLPQVAGPPPNQLSAASQRNELIVYGISAVAVLFLPGYWKLLGLVGPVFLGVAGAMSD
jgi:hypothetical protein